MKETKSSLRALLGRLSWMLFGPMFLLFATIAVVRAGPGWLTSADIFFLAVLGGMLLGRWLEFSSGAALTATGEPATRRDLHRYLVFAGLAGIALWVVANLFANYWLV